MTIECAECGKEYDPDDLIDIGDKEIYFCECGYENVWVQKMNIKYLKLGDNDLTYSDCDDLITIQKLVNKEFDSKLNEINKFLKEIIE